VPADVWQPPEENREVLTVQDEAKLLLGELDLEALPGESSGSVRKNVKFKVVANAFIDVRKEPDVNGERVPGESLKIGDQILVSEVVPAQEGFTYLKLADGRGWVFDKVFVNGSMLQLLEPVDMSEVLNKRAKKGRRPKVCMRCWSLWHYNECDDIYRPNFGMPADDEITADDFEKMIAETLRPLTDAAVIAVVDVYDFGPSARMLEFLGREIAGKKGLHLHIVANKIDLLPQDVNLARVKGWVMREAQKNGLDVRSHNIFPCSTAKKWGIKPVSNLMEARDAPREFYVVGAANAGKSSLMNRLCARKRKAANHLSSVDADGFTVSDLPGTTLKPTVIKWLKADTQIVDTPGLLSPGSYTSILTHKELHDVTPKKNGVIRVTFAMDEGRSVLMGGLARVDMLKGRESQFTFFNSLKVKLHRCSMSRAEQTLRGLVKNGLSPPYSRERMEELQPWVQHTFQVQGAGWEEAAVDVVIHGLGWIAVTTSGPVTLRVMAPKGVDVSIRDEPLLPYEAKWTGVKYGHRPGWYRVNGRSTRGMEVGRNRMRVLRGKF